MAAEVAAGHGLVDDLDIATCPPVWADRVLIKQVLGNLLGNAAKYRHPDRPLKVSLTGHEDQGTVTLYLTDNGLGIPTEDTKKVFERFYRSSPIRDSHPGTGIGLAMCRTAVERHGGTIAALPSPGGSGTRIAITLSAPPVVERRHLAAVNENG